MPPANHIKFLNMNDLIVGYVNFSKATLIYKEPCFIGHISCERAVNIFLQVGIKTSLSPLSLPSRKTY